MAPVEAVAGNPLPDLPRDRGDLPPRMPLQKKLPEIHRRDESAGARALDHDADRDSSEQVRRPRLPEAVHEAGSELGDPALGGEVRLGRVIHARKARDVGAQAGPGGGGEAIGDQLPLDCHRGGIVGRGGAASGDGKRGGESNLNARRDVHVLLEDCRKRAGYRAAFGWGFAEWRGFPGA